jgi:hypothetical protein
MAYNDFTLDALITQFRLQGHEERNAFASFTSLPISDLLQQMLQENLPWLWTLTQKRHARSSSLLLYLQKCAGNSSIVSAFFSGVEFNVDSAQGLRGVCDFLFSLSPLQLTIQVPVVMGVEAKNENVKQGIGQCIAEMIAAQQFNQERHNAIGTVYGVVTSGNLWKFLRLTEMHVVVDATEYHISQVERIVGILVAMLKEAAGEPPLASSVSSPPWLRNTRYV